MCMHDKRLFEQEVLTGAAANSILFNIYCASANPEQSVSSQHTHRQRSTVVSKMLFPTGNPKIMVSAFQHRRIKQKNLKCAVLLFGLIQPSTNEDVLRCGLLDVQMLHMLDILFKM